MTRYRYPRLSTVEALRILDELPENPVPRLDYLAAPAPTGGSRVPTHVLEEVRAGVKDAIRPWEGSSTIPRRDVARWDHVVGKTLMRTMQIIPSDAASDGVWAYLTLLVLPDVAITRFPGITAERMLGGPRNVFRKTWWRELVLEGVEIPPGTRPLGEDELVGIFERSRLSRDHRLARIMATEIMEYRGRDRSEFARMLAVLVNRETGPRVLDLLDDTEIASLVESLGRQLNQKSPPKDTAR